ncbi:hypothetical protein KEJ51_05785 [Candidatus Bathyarchaeota archaeon]|nr:hypothetical protein [Candidatus Bathyarchaeota archaeon]MBS7629741.1 hypothetical protein [Candidatus Bathyarchaeota archaeon]
MVRLAFGGFLLILGFVGYQVGFQICMSGEGVLTKFLTLFLSPALPLEVLGLVLQFGGGVLAIIGFLLCITALSKPIVRVERVEAAGETSISKLQCKFCGGRLEEDSVFCPLCGKSQV